MSLKGVPHKQAFLSQKTAESWLPHFLYPQLHSNFIHPPLQMTVYENSGWKVLFWQLLLFKDHHRLRLCSICQAHKYDCELWFLVTSCVDQHSFLAFPISHSQFWLMAGQTKQAFCPCCRCGQVCNLASFCSWWRSCGSLQSSGQDLLETFGQSFSSVKEQDSSIEGTSYTTGWRPGTRLSEFWWPLPSPWWWPCFRWRCSHCLCSLIQQRSLSFNSGHWHCFLWLQHLFLGMHFSFLACFCQSQTNFSLMQNSRPAA